MVADVTDLSSVLRELADLHEELCQQIMQMQRNGPTNRWYHMKKYQHGQLSIAIHAIQNAYMSLPDNFDKAKTLHDNDAIAE